MTSPHERVDGAADELPIARSGAGTNHIVADPATGKTACGRSLADDDGDFDTERSRPVPRREVPNAVDCKSCYKAQAEAELNAFGVDQDDLEEQLVVRYWTAEPLSSVTAFRTTGRIRSLPPWTLSLGDHSIDYDDRVEIVDEHGGLTFSSAVPFDRILEILDDE